MSAAVAPHQPRQPALSTVLAAHRTFGSAEPLPASSYSYTLCALIRAIASLQPHMRVDAALQLAEKYAEELEAR